MEDLNKQVEISIIDKLFSAKFSNVISALVIGIVTALYWDFKGFCIISIILLLIKSYRFYTIRRKLRLLQLEIGLVENCENLTPFEKKMNAKGHAMGFTIPFVILMVVSYAAIGLSSFFLTVHFFVTP